MQFKNKIERLEFLIFSLKYMIEQTNSNIGKLLLLERLKTAQNKLKKLIK